MVLVSYCLSLLIMQYHTNQKPLSQGHLTIRDKMLVPNGVCYKGALL